MTISQIPEHFNKGHALMPQKRINADVPSTPTLEQRKQWLQPDDQNVWPSQSPHPARSHWCLAGVTAMVGMIMTSGAWANCPASPEIALVSVGALHDSPSVRYSYPVGQIADLASVVGHKGAHPPYGFYASTLTYSVNVQAAPNSTVADPACVPALSIQLDLQLVDRIVEIGTGGTCNHDVVAAHYLAHADQDDRLLRRYAELARTRLGTMVGSRLERFEQNGNWEAAMKRLAQGIIEELLRNYDMDKQGALASADTNDELARLREACTSRTL